MFFTAFVLFFFIKLKTEGQTIYRKPHCKIKILAYPGTALSNRPRSSAFRLGEIYILFERRLDFN